MGGMIDNTLAANVPQFNLANTLQQGAQAQAAQDAVQAEQLKTKQNAIGAEMRGVAPFVNTPEFPQRWEETFGRMRDNGLIGQDVYDRMAKTPSALMIKSITAQTDSPEMALKKDEDAQAQKNTVFSQGIQTQELGLRKRAADRADQTPLEAAQERAKAAEAQGLKPGTPEYTAYNLTGKLPDTSTSLPNSAAEYEYYKRDFKPTPTQPAPMDYGTFSTAKARAGATNVSTNVDMNSGQTYDKQLAEGLGKSHAGLANGVEDAQSRARDIAAMQGAVDAIQKNNGTTGGLAPAARLELQKSINAGAAAVGIDKPFSEADISDKEFLTKFNRSMAGAQAKNAVGSRVTNFEMSNFLKANPGLDMTVTGNQRLLGIQAQIEQRNIAVGNAIRDATAEAISKGQKIDPVTVQKIVTDYDHQHHVKDPVSGQDLTQSVALPEFQEGGTNPAAAARHNANIGKIRKYNPATGALE